ncbi:hypothetical protein BTM162_15030 [Helicobacter pylori]
MLSKITFNQRKTKKRLFLPPATKNAKNKSSQAKKKDQKTTKKVSFSLDFLEPKKVQDNTSIP